MLLLHYWVSCLIADSFASTNQLSTDTLSDGQLLSAFEIDTSAHANELTSRVRNCVKRREAKTDSVCWLIGDSEVLRGLMRKLTLGDPGLVSVIRASLDSRYLRNRVLSLFASLEANSLQKELVSMIPLLASIDAAELFVAIVRASPKTAALVAEDILQDMEKGLTPGLESGDLDRYIFFMTDELKMRRWMFTQLSVILGVEGIGRGREQDLDLLWRLLEVPPPMQPRASG